MKILHDNYEIDEDNRRLDFARITDWLTKSYWSPGVSRETCERAARFSSLVVGVYLDKTQVGYLRVISDRATFGWIADVFVDEQHRKKGLAKAMLKFALDHPQHQGMRKWCLATQDAHDVYKAVGFGPLEFPSNFMVHRPGNQKPCSRSE